jgi:hypothetical protein
VGRGRRLLGAPDPVAEVAGFDLREDIAGDEDSCRMVGLYAVRV